MGQTWSLVEENIMSKLQGVPIIATPTPLLFRFAGYCMYHLQYSMHLCTSPVQDPGSKIQRNTLYMECIIMKASQYVVNYHQK